MARAMTFRFLDAPHVYVSSVTGKTFPSITQMLKDGGHIDDSWYNEEACERGTAVHALTAQHDLGVLTRGQIEAGLDPFSGAYRGYVLSYLTVMDLFQPEILTIEEPYVSPTYQFGGRIDRGIRLRRRLGILPAGTLAVLEIKTGAFAKSHPMQTALQAVLEADRRQVSVETIARFCCYVQETGRGRLEWHRDDPQNMREAMTLIRRFC